jgi:hypothetical protein
LSGPATTKTIDDYLRSKASDDTTFELLKFGVHRSLFKKYGDASAPASTFVDVPQQPFRPEPETDRKIDQIAQWFAAEVAQNAPWIQQRNAGGVPLRLTATNIDHLAGAASKWEKRAKADTPGPAKEADIAPGTLHLDDTARAAWPMFSKKTPEEFHREMTEGLPRGTSMTVELSDKGAPALMRFDYGQDEKNKFLFIYKFGEEGAHYESASVSRKMRENGISKIVNTHFIEHCEKSGIGVVTIEAQHIGAYAQARLGFVPHPEDWQQLRRKVEGRLDWLEEHPAQGEHPLPIHYSDTLRKALKMEDPKAFWLVTDQEHTAYGVPLGKLLTLPKENLPGAVRKQVEDDKGFLTDPRWDKLSWQGALDLKDKDCMQRLNAYLRPDKAKAAPSLRQELRSSVSHQPFPGAEP